MADYVMADEMDDELGDFDAGGSTNSDNEKVDSILIKKILNEMKSEFNRATCSIANNTALKEEEDPLNTDGVEDENLTTNGINTKFTEDSSTNPQSISDTPVLKEPGTPPQSKIEVKEEADNNIEGDDRPELMEVKQSEEKNCIPEISEEGKPLKDSDQEKTMPSNGQPEENIGRRRSLRNLEKVEPDTGLKRSSRRMSRESVLQSAIALKEKSFGTVEEKRKRRSLRNTDTDQKSNNLPKNKNRNTRSTPSDPLVNVTTAVFATNIESNNQLSIHKKNVSKGIKPNEMDNVEDIINLDEDTFAARVGHKIEEASAKVFKKGNSLKVFKDMWADCESSNSTNMRKTIDGIKLSCGEVLLGKTSLKANKRKVGDDVVIEAKKPYSFMSSVIEGSEPPTSAEKIPTIQMANVGALCECQTNNELYPGPNSFSSPQYCKAVDTFEQRHIGCCNIADSETPLLRPSKTVPHLLLCKEHIQRLIRHNACPSCGLFCTQGIFMSCCNYHYYHKDCESRKGNTVACPHCGTEEAQEVKLSLGAHKYPVFLPMQKPPNKYPSARMSFNNGLWNGDLKQKNEDKSLVKQPVLVLPSGHKISSEGIPTLEKEKLEKLLHAYNSQNAFLQRYTYRNLYQAAKNGQVDKIIQILGTGMNPNQAMRDGGAGLCALHAAASAGHLAAVHILIQSGANPDVLDRDQYTPLMLACLNKHNEVVKYLVKAGSLLPFKGADGMTALHIAAKEGNLEACHYLLSSANTPQSYADTVDDGRWTPLVWAAENCCTQVVRFLLDNKADPQIRDSEMNIALHWAAFAGSMEITEDLLNYGSNLNLSNTHGDTPLHIAARQNAQNCVVLLLARGARVDVLNKAGQTPKDCVPDQNSYCYTAIELNMVIKRIMATTPSYPRILSNDISRGYESNPIQCINSIDDDGLPTDFTYITENCLTTNFSVDRRITSLTSCKCEDTCVSAGCLCAKISFRCWYDSKEKLFPDFNFEDPPMLFECNQTCDCSALICKNRVVQRGIKIRMQLCKTRHKNWGVITLKTILKGTYVCEYIGEIISDCEADTREDDSYLFDLDNRDGETYCIDARKYGNIARFINHSCKPNLSPVRVFIGHHDLHFPRIAFFANRDIMANEELGFDYGEKFWIIKCKSFTCMCEADCCRYSELKIQETLEKYREKLKQEES